MPTVETAAALLEHLTDRDISAARPAERRRLALACRRAAEMAEPGGPVPLPRSGVLASLRYDRAD